MPSIDKLSDIKDRGEDIVSRPKKKKMGKVAPPFISAAFKMASLATKKGRNARPVGPIAKYFDRKRKK